MSTAELPMLSVFILSYNKNGYAQEAVASVLDQDYKNYDLHIIENSTDGVTREALWDWLRANDTEGYASFYAEDVPEEVRAGCYVPSWLLNKYYPIAAPDSIILYLSDDDLFVPGIFRAIADTFIEYPHWDALYFHLARTNASAPGEGTHWEDRFAEIAATGPRGNGEVDCQIDGGQVAYYKRCLDQISQPYFGEELGASANHADGLHLNKIASVTPFQPLPERGVIHRHTSISTWSMFLS